MSDDIYFEEEEFSTQFNGQTIKRIAQQAWPRYWTWIVGFVSLVALVSFQDSFFTYLSKLIIDEGIIPGDINRLTQIVSLYAALIVVQAAAVFGFVRLT